MHKSVGRLLFGLLLACSAWSTALAADQVMPVQESMTWQLKVGGSSADGALQAQAFLPSTVTINVGDTINWTVAPVHTVTFLSGSPPPPFAVPSGNEVMLNPAAALPAGGPTYDGSGYANSGILPGQTGNTWALTFSKAGTYGYLCLLHPGMVGQVVVQPAGSAYPISQAQVDAQANAELYDKLSTANQFLQRARLTSQPGARGTTNYTVVNGTGGNQASVLRFLPVDVTVQAGDSITWVGDDPHEVHTVTLYDPAGPVPGFIEPRPQPNGPPMLLLRNTAPEGGREVTGPGLYNSGLVGPGQAYTLTFKQPGVYPYVCVLHVAEGMTGTITVQAAAPPAAAPPPAAPPSTGAPLPAALPDTGADSAWSVPLGLIAALALVLIGVSMTRRHRRTLR